MHRMLPAPKEVAVHYEVRHIFFLSVFHCQLMSYLVRFSLVFMLNQHVFSAVLPDTSTTMKFSNLRNRISKDNMYQKVDVSL